MLWLACVKFLITLEAFKNRRIYAFFIEFSDKFFGLEMMLLPRMSTMLCSTRFLECHVGVFDVRLDFFVACRKAFPLTYLVFLRDDILGIQPPRMKTSLKLYFVSSFLNFKQFAISCFINFLRGLFTQNVVTKWVVFKKIFSYLQVSELVLQFFRRTARPCKFRREVCRRLEDKQSVQNSTFGQMRL